MGRRDRIENRWFDKPNIEGSYSMNFADQYPVTDKMLPQNLRELYQEDGYLYLQIIMGAIAEAQIIYFWRKGWFK
ncbi:MAG: hypothetical protein H7223_08345 [Pedobacter sp.]|nr:hypothetical protein [Pedobacter sp.]